jgi:hypothetical protein
VKKILIALLILSLIALVDCRTPKLGDNVTVDLGNAYFTGIVSDVADGYIGLNESIYHAEGYFDRPMNDICIGWGKIVVLKWT